MVDYGYCRGQAFDLASRCPHCERLMLSRMEYATRTRADGEEEGLGFLVLLVCSGADDPERPCSYQRLL